MIIGITGPICSGKGELAKIFEEKGFSVLSFGEEVRIEALARKIELTRDNLQTLGHELTSQFGEGYWSKRILARIKDNGKYVVEGFRYPGQIEEFKKRGDFILVGITADFNVRFERYAKKRKRDGDGNSLEEFKIAEERDKGENRKDGQSSSACYKMIDYEIVNDDDLEGLRKKVDNLLKELGL